MEHWLTARIISSGEVKKVRQGEAGGRVFIDESNEVYAINNLDFNVVQEGTVIDMSNASPVFNLAKVFEHKSEEIESRHAGIEERIYWRNFRGELLLRLLDNDEQGNPEVLLNNAKILFDGIYYQTKKHNS